MIGYIINMAAFFVWLTIMGATGNVGDYLPAAIINGLGAVYFLVRA